MGFAKQFTKLTVNLFVDTLQLFVDKAKSKEVHVMLHELKNLDKRLKKEYIDSTHAKKEFEHLFHNLENTIQRLMKKGEKFEAQHIYHVFERYAQAFNDKALLKKLRKLHP